MSEINNLIEKINQFIAERDWDQFQKPKDLAISLVLESTEVLEHFQWKNGEELETYLNSHKDEVGDELADVFIYLLELSQKVGIDLLVATNSKMQKNALKYPIDKSSGNHKKYLEL